MHDLEKVFNGLGSSRKRGLCAPRICFKLLLVILYALEITLIENHIYSLDDHRKQSTAY